MKDAKAPDVLSGSTESPPASIEDFCKTYPNLVTFEICRDSTKRFAVKLQLLKPASCVMMTFENYGDSLNPLIDEIIRRATRWHLRSD